MKALSFVISASLLFSVAHAETRDFKKNNAETATVHIITDEKDSTQAAMYLDGKENQKLIAMMLADPASKLAKLKAQIEMENCEETSKPENPWIDMCGQVEISDLVKTSFSRGGWAEGSAGYSFFVGFRQDGTGRFLESTHLVEINESVYAKMDKNGNYIGKIEKHLHLEPIKKLK